jgi:DNA repair protein RecN (Recombination protein N)
MLKELRIKNLAIIDDLTLRFGKGLNVLTGETGAGKSIIVDALGLALGDRAQSDMIKSGQTDASVQAFFDFDRPLALPVPDIDTSEGLFIRRVISSAGKSRAYINDTMVTLQTLSEVGKSLVDLMSQHEHQSLLSSDNQREILDLYGRLHQERERVASIYREVRDLEKECRMLGEKVRERSQRLDLLRFQIDEIDSANLASGEKASLGQEKQILANLGKLSALAESTYSLLYESEGSCLEKLSQVRTQLREISLIDNTMEDALKTIEAAVPLIEDASIIIRGYKDRYDLDPARLEFVEERLETLKRLEKRYGENMEEIIKYRDNARVELESLESADERLSDIGNQLDLKNTELTAASAVLSDKRKKTGHKLEGLISDTLRDLAFGDPGFSIEIIRETDNEGKASIGTKGFDHIEFRFTANPGEPLKPLSRIISGGELSRVMLALKSILAGVDNTPVLIFDEVDAGIGGSAAESVGRKLDALSGSHQVICITHLPQIATYADCHMKIEKNALNNRVTVEVKELTGKDRKNEIARMLSGNITDISLRHAGELLEKDR